MVDFAYQQSLVLMLSVDAQPYKAGLGEICEVKERRQRLLLVGNFHGQQRLAVAYHH